MTSNKLLVSWVPTMKVGLIHMPESERDYHNSDSVKLYRVISAGPGRYTRKGAFVPNEISPGDNVIVDARIGGRPQEFGKNTYLITNPDTAVIAVVPRQTQPESASA